MSPELKSHMSGIARKLLATLVTVGLIVAGVALAQDPSSGIDRPDRLAQGEFEFVRLAYNGNPYYGGRAQQSWSIDYPDAEHHFLKGIRRLTAVEAAEDGIVRTPLDNDIFDYPWLYVLEVGYWYLNDQEAARLREYLLRGGFLMIDDFHGTFEWTAFMTSMNKIFPDRPVVEIPEGDEVFHVLYDLDQRIQIPSLQIMYTGVTYERDGFTPQWRGIYDDDGRLMVAINHNMDIGDAWEHADLPEYPENMTALAYRFGVNYVIYAMTH
jgi:hypothetical protein